MLKFIKFVILLMVVPKLCFGGISLDFDGSNDYGDITDSSSMNGAQVASYAAWINVDNAPVVGDAYIHNILGDENVTRMTYNFRLGSGGVVGNADNIGLVYYDTSSHDTQNTTNISLDVWTHIAVTTDGTNARFYVNGVLTDTVAYTFTPTQQTNTFYIGRVGFNTTRRWDGLLSNLIFSAGSAFTAAEITEAMWKPELAAKDRKLYITFMDGVTTGRDLSGNGNTVTWTGVDEGTTAPNVMFGGGLPL